MAEPKKEKEKEQVYPKLIIDMARKYKLTPNALIGTITKQCFPKDKEPTREQVVAFLSIADHYDLNPLAKEIWAFPSSNGIQPVVSVDGWARIVTRNADYDGNHYEYEYADPVKKEGLVSITCQIFRKNHSHPTEATEWMSECKKSTPMWNQWPKRMLKHKAFIQCARMAFAISGIIDDEESFRYAEAAPLAERNAENVTSLLEKIQMRPVPAWSEGEAPKELGRLEQDAVEAEEAK